jgi:hypothetical protein
MRYKNAASRARVQASNHADVIIRAIRKIRGPGAVVEKDAVRDKIEVCLLTHPTRGASKRQAAVHEAGHLVAYEAEAMVAVAAAIRRVSQHCQAWTGWALCINCPYTQYGPLPHDPEDFLRDASAALAGPWAEALLGDGDALGSLAEVCEARLLVSQGAQIMNRSNCDIWRETLVRTHANEIEKIADILMRSQQVAAVQPSIRKILQRIRPMQMSGHCVSPRCEELIRQVEANAPRIEELLGALP